MPLTNYFNGTLTPSTLVDLLSWRAREQPGKTVYRFLVDGDAQDKQITYFELEKRAKAIAASLQERTRPGDRVLLLYPPGLEYIAAYFGSLYAGVIAVTAYPPRLNRPAPRLQAIITDSGARNVLTTAQVLENIQRRFELNPEMAALDWQNSDEISNSRADGWSKPKISSETIAFLQYTSGSTSSPKGVVITHGNLMHNMGMISHGFQIHPHATAVFWLPLYHDMGLIGGVLTPMYVGGSSTLLSPAAFLQRPFRWLQAITHYKPAISGAPNFAYQMCLDRITTEQRAELDLSSWRVAFCGAEPIHPATLRQFASAFAEHGFRSEAFYPCYGLAEATLIASGSEGPGQIVTSTVDSVALGLGKAIVATDGTTARQEIVCCGKALLDQEIVIVHPDTRLRCADNEVGEIWVSGPSIAQGYWQQPEASAQTFGAKLADSETGSYLRTGDLGFLHEEHLYITGRLKDLIIIRGRNHYPQDIERTVAESHHALEPGMGAAFSVEAPGGERLVVIHEVARQHRGTNMDGVVTAVRRAVALHHEVELYALVLIKPLTIPRTSSGKIKRFACRERFLKGTLDVVNDWYAAESDSPAETAQTVAYWPEEDLTAQSVSSAAVESWLVYNIAAKMQMAPGAIDVKQPFVDYGLDSLYAVTLAGQLETLLNRRLSPTLVWDYPTIRELAEFLGSAEDNRQPVVVADQFARGDEPVAVVGLGNRFPGASSPDAFWNLLTDGVDAISEVPSDRWNAEAFYDPDSPPGKMNTRWGGFLERVDEFDPYFFNIAPREAARMDPQQRLLLEVAWEALENAGQAPSQLAGSNTGVFVGISSYDYSRLQFSDLHSLDIYAGTGNAHSIAANRLSYLLDLRGPSMAVDTACSSSLVAVHLACQSLRHGETDLAIAGGVNLILSPEVTVFFAQGRAMAGDGRCKTFDARADGYVRSEGCGVVILKRLSQAIGDGDQILAVIRGSAVNQDGRSNGLTAPNGRSQQAVIQQALANARVQPSAVSYIEAHGTGTPLGDPIEIQALRAVYENGRSSDQSYAVGSAKTNVGHLEAAAGIAGLIKVILSLQNELIPAQLHFQTLNPHIDLTDSSLQIVTENRPWLRGSQPRLAGISSFGFGGTNAHVIISDPPFSLALEEPTHSAPSHARVLNEPKLSAGRENDHHLLMLSAKREEDLIVLAGNYSSYLAQNNELSLADICYTAANGRSHFDHRLAITAASHSQMQKRLQAFIDGRKSGGLAHGQGLHGQRPRIAFLFSSPGAQYPYMGQELYETQAAFRAAIDQCAALLENFLDVPLLQILYPAIGQPAGPTSLGAGSENACSEERIHNLAYAQPALFALEYALVELWRSWGIEPDIVIGHSMGEYVAACAAGVFSLEEGLRLICERSRLMQSAPQEGMMATVFGQEEQVRRAVEPYGHLVDIAAHNSPGHVVVSGEKSAVTAILSQLENEGVANQILAISQAAHSPLMEPILDEFEPILNTLNYRPTRIPLVSTLTGKLLEPGAMLDAGHWRRHLRETVNFAGGVLAVAKFGASIFVEIGPDTSLLTLARRSLPKEAAVAWLPSLRNKRDDRQVLLDALGGAYAAGLTISWRDNINASRRRKVALPTYPFNRQRYWLDPSIPTAPQTVQRANDLTRLPAGLPIFEMHVDTSNGVPLSTIYEKLVKRAAAEVLENDNHTLQELALTDPPPSPNPRTTLQVIFIPETNKSAEFRLFSHDSGNGGWHLRAHGRIQHGANGESQAAGGEEPFAKAALQSLTEAQRSTAVTSFLVELTASVLGLDKEKMPVDQPLDTFGIDSLMALELKAGVEKGLEISLPIVNFLQPSTIADLAAQLLNTLSAPQTTIAAIRPVSNAGQPHPLSFNQQALWFLHELLPEAISFNVAGAVRLRGRLNVSALRVAFQKLISRHPMLRTTFIMSQGQPAQQVHADLAAPFQEINALDWDDEVLEKYLVREAYSPFDLENGPILKMRVLARPQQEHVLLLAMDHMIIELWSLSIMIHELYQLYLAEINGTPENLPPLEVQYTDFVHWEAELLAGSVGERQRAYWLKQLGGELPILDLPTDRPRPAAQTYAGDTVNRRLDSSLTGRLRQLSQEQGATLYMVLLAGFQTLLHRYTAQDKLLVGSVLAGRDRPELAQLVGYFINPVAMKADFSGDPSFESLLHQVRQTVLDAYANPNYPLPLLAEHLALMRDPSRPPLFETMFIMQKAQTLGGQSLSSFAPGMPNSVLNLGEFSIETIRLPQMPAQFDLTLMIAEMDGGLGLSFHYNRDLFDRATMKRMLDHFASLLAEVGADPKQPVSSISLLSKAEQEQLAQMRKQPTTALSPEVCVTQMIEKQAALTPEAVAIICADDAVTYDQLNRRANRLAHLLQKKGIAPGELVGICMDRSIDMVVGLLGILKAGGAYVPLDPAFPQERLAIMIADAQPSLILTQEHLSQDLLALASADSLFFLDNGQSLLYQPETDVALDTRADELAYVIYTSGSTGRPKGVMVSHRNLVNFLTSMQNEPGLTAADTLLAVTTLSFDIAGLELFLPLTVGAKLVIATTAGASDGLRLQELIAQSKTTIMQATPATWQMLLEAGWAGSDELKILCGGETLPRDLANRLLKRSRELWNMYGPTETTVWSAVYRVTPGEGPIPIGKPIANTQIYVLDKQLQPVPQGVVGDLYIGGAGVTKGYLGRPELTAKKFIANPFGGLKEEAGSAQRTGGSSAILYKSDDKARLLPDGNLLFLGRDDHQVKVRGFRIELGDIESALAQHTAVKQAVVTAAGNAPQNKQLVAYLVLHKDSDPVPAESVRAFLREKLPEYMLPAVYVFLEKLPLAPNGKLDRKALPPPSESRPDLNAPYLAPRTPLEKQIAEMCTAVLGLDKVGIYDNFFDLGGNSLLATRLIFQIREAFQVQLPLRYLFADSTVSGLSKAVLAAQAADTQMPVNKAWQPSLVDEMSVGDLNAEARLDESIPQIDLPLAAIKVPEHVLLTGATGFVGAYLLNDLLAKTGAVVHCLVRSGAAADGMGRLRQNLQIYNLWQDQFAARIRIVPGDLSQQRLGLSPHQFDELARHIDVIYHNGATVNFVHSYQTHKGSNVLGTQEILRLAGRHKLKAVHFVSTLSVLHTGAQDDGSVFFEDDELDQIGAPYGGYAKSKWVAEKLVKEAGRRGMPTAIYRPGLISGDSETGAANTADMISSLLQVCLKTGKVPDLDVQVDIVPVNYVSATIVHLSLQSDFAGQVFHLSNPRRMHYRAVTDWFSSAGYNLEPVPFSVWRDNLINIAAHFSGGGWDAFLPLLEEAEVEQAFMPAFDCRNTLAALAGSDVTCAPVDARLLGAYLAFLERSSPF